MTATRPRLENVELHAVILSREFTEDVSALDHDALCGYLIGRDLELPNPELCRVPAVCRDPDSLFSVPSWPAQAIGPCT